MPESRIPKPSKAPEVPPKSPNRPKLSSLPVPKRSAEPSSLRHDPRPIPVSSIENDRKRRGIVFDVDAEVQKKVKYEEHGDKDKDGKSLDNIDPKASTHNENSSQHSDSAIDLRSDTPILGILSNIPPERRSLLPRPLSLKPRVLTGTSTCRAQGDGNSTGDRLDVTNPVLSYSDSEYSNDDDAMELGSPKQKRENEDPKKYNHEVDAYLSASLNSMTMPTKSPAEPAVAELEDTGPDASLKRIAQSSNHSSTTAKDATTGQKSRLRLREKPRTTPDIWFEVDSRSLTFSKTITYELECKSRVSRSKEPYGAWLVDLKVDFMYEGKTIAFINGRFLRRTAVKSNFQETIQIVNQTVAKIPADVFDRYGRLKKELKDHEVLKGTGIWGDEFDHGDLFIVDCIQLDDYWAHTDLGAGMIQHVLAVARKKRLMPAFALIDPVFSTQTMRDDSGTQSDPASKNFLVDRLSIIDVLRHTGFRRIGLSRCFGYACDQLHPSRYLSAEDDRKWDCRIGNSDHQFNISAEMKSEEFFGSSIEAPYRMRKLVDTHFLHWATMTQPEDRCIELYSTTQKKSEFINRDPLYRNVLHVAAFKQKAQCVLWLLQNVKSPQYLKTARNLSGYTPLEELEARLEELRISNPYFQGFPENAVECLIALRNDDHLEDVARQRLKFGCTCGLCVEGFMSPRTQYALTCRATKIFHCLDRNIYDSDNEPWTEQNSHILKYVIPEVQPNLDLSQHLRQGFNNVFFHIADVVEKNIIPSTATVKYNAWEERKHQPHVPGWIFVNGTTDAAIQIVFEMAMEKDEWAGSGNMSGENEIEMKEELMFRAEFALLPACRNDHEWEFVARMCGLKELRREDKVGK